MQHTQELPPRFLTPQELSERWTGIIRVTTLANWRSRGCGPMFKKFGGKVAYPIEKVVEWEQHNLVGGTGQYRPD